MGYSFVYCLIFLGFLYKLGSYEMQAIVKFEELLLLYAKKSNFVFYVNVGGGERWLLMCGEGCN